MTGVIGLLMTRPNRAGALEMELSFIYFLKHFINALFLHLTHDRLILKPLCHSGLSHLRFHAPDTLCSQHKTMLFNKGIIGLVKCV